MQRKDRFGVRKLALLAMFTAMAYAVTFIFRINVSFLTFDAKDSIVCLVAMILGPLSGAVVSLLVATLEQLSVGDTGFWGWLMDIASTATFSVVAGWIYTRRRTIFGVFLSLTSAVISMVAVMIVCNLLITPIYMKVELGQVIGLIPTLLLPFNFAKAMLNAGIVLALYKPLITALRAAKLLPKPSRDNGESKRTFFCGVRSYLIALIAILLILSSVLYLVWGMDGQMG